MVRAPQDTIVARIARHAAERPEATAIIFDDRETSYAQLHRDSNRTARALLAAGIQPQSRVAYIGRESDLYYDLVIACAKAGAVLVPVNWRLTAAEITHILRDSDAEILFCEADFTGVVEAARPDLTRLREVVEIDTPEQPYAGYHHWRAGQPDTDLDLRPSTDDPVAQMYTSGTTGLPKGVVLAHRTFFTFIAGMQAGGVDWIDWRPEDRSLTAFPGLHAGGYAWFLHTLNVGGTSVVMRTFVAEEAVRLIQRHQVTILWAAPAMLQMMLAEPGVTRETFRSMRKTVYGGSPIHQELLQQCIAGISGDIVQAYAAAETGSFITCLPAQEHVPGNPKLGSAGRITPGNDVRIVGEDDQPLGPNEPGRICVRTPAEFVEYWHRPEETAKMKRGDGWLYMRDSGYLDEDGYLYLKDRIDDTIIVAGQNIYPVEVEEVIRTHAAVGDVAVFGVPHPRWGEAVWAAVVTRDGAELTGRDLMKFLHGRLAGFKIPVKYHFMAEIPRNPTGKVLRRVLKAETAAPETATPETATAATAAPAVAAGR